MKKLTTIIDLGTSCLNCGGKALLLLIVTVILFSCKSVKTTINDQSSYSSKDSIRTVFIERIDSFFVHDTLVVHDTTYIQQEKNTNIQFGVGGGTYNAITGEATNVTSLSLNETILQLQVTNRIQASTIVDLTKENTLLNNRLSTFHGQKDIQTSVKETTANNWYVWLIIGAILGSVIMFALIFALKKIPVTSWLVSWI